MNAGTNITFSSEDSRQRFIQFFYNHMKRTPDFNEPLIEKVKSEVFGRDLEAEFERSHRPLTEDERGLLEQEEFRDRSLSYSRVSNMGSQSVKILNRLASLRIIVATPQRASKQFIIGSNPVVRFEDHAFQELGSPGVEVWTTLTPRLAVGFAHADRAMGQEGDILYLDDRAVRTINLSLAKKSGAIAGRSSPLLLSLKKAAW